MSETITLAKRLDAVERDVAELKHRVLDAPEARPWYERMIGSMKDYPEFEEVVRLGQQMRKENGVSERLGE